MGCMFFLFHFTIMACSMGEELKLNNNFTVRVGVWVVYGSRNASQRCGTCLPSDNFYAEYFNDEMCRLSLLKIYYQLISICILSFSYVPEKLITFI